MTIHSQIQYEKVKKQILHLMNKGEVNLAEIERWYLKDMASEAQKWEQENMDAPVIENEVNEGHFIEAKHTCYIIQEMIESFLITHAAIENNKEWVKKLEAATELIYQVYNDIP